MTVLLQQCLFFLVVVLCLHGVSGDCTECSRGKYTDVLGSTECKICPTHTNTSSSQIAATSVEQCICQGLYGIVLENPPVCEVCEVGQEVLDNQCQACSNSHVRDADDLTCRLCPNHTTPAANNGSCLCNNGYSPGLTKHEPCIKDQQQLDVIDVLHASSVGSDLLTILKDVNLPPGATVRVVLHGNHTINPIILRRGIDQWYPVNIAPMHFKDNVYNVYNVTL